MCFRVSSALTARAEGVAVHARHHDVAEDEVGVLVPDERQALLGRGRELQVELVARSIFISLRTSGLSSMHEDQRVVDLGLVHPAALEVDLLEVDELEPAVSP